MSELRDGAGGRVDGRAGDPLFRDEALRDYVQGRTHGKLLRISPRWTRWVEPLLLATVVAAGLFLGFATVDHVVVGPAIVRRAAAHSVAGGNLLSDGDSLEVVALLAGRDHAFVPASPELIVRFEGDAVRSLALPASALVPEILGPDRARAQLGEAADLVPIDGPTFLLRAPLPRDAAEKVRAVPGAIGRAEILVGRRRLLTDLLSRGAS